MTINAFYPHRLFSRNRNRSGNYFEHRDTITSFLFVSAKNTKAHSLRES